MRCSSFFPAGLAASLALAGSAFAQDHYLYTVMQPEFTLSGSGATILEELYPNEIVQFVIDPTSCPTNSAEKWAPRTAFHTVAGDEDGDDQYWNPSIFGRIDAVMGPLFSTNPVGRTNMREVFFSPQNDMGTTVSGAPGLRAGDVGRIVRIAGNDGQVEHFITAEQIQTALGMPIAPIVVNVDAVCAGPNHGVFFSLENNHGGLATWCGITSTLDGDVWWLPAGSLTWTPNGTVATVTPGAAERIYGEPQMDNFVANARVTDRNGVCLNQIIDTDGLEIDYLGPTTAYTSCSGISTFLPTLIFTGQSMTGASVLDTAFGGRVRPGSCGLLGTNCPFGPTYGNQMGLRPTSSTQGVASSINGIALAFACRFVLESPTPQQIAPASIDIHIAGPGPNAWLFAGIAPAGIGAVAPTLPLWFPSDCFPDRYPACTFFMGVVPTPGGFGTYTSPPLAFPLDIVWQAVEITGPFPRLSTPATTELF